MCVIQRVHAVGMAVGESKLYVTYLKDALYFGFTLHFSRLAVRLPQFPRRHDNQVTSQLNIHKLVLCKIFGIFSSFSSALNGLRVLEKFLTVFCNNSSFIKVTSNSKS